MGGYIFGQPVKPTLQEVERAGNVAPSIKLEGATIFTVLQKLNRLTENVIAHFNGLILKTKIKGLQFNQPIKMGGYIFGQPVKLPKILITKNSIS